MNDIIFNKQGMPNLTAPLKELLHNLSSKRTSAENVTISGLQNLSGQLKGWLYNPPSSLAQNISGNYIHYRGKKTGRKINRVKLLVEENFSHLHIKLVNFPRLNFGF